MTKNSYILDQTKFTQNFIKNVLELPKLLSTYKSARIYDYQKCIFIILYKWYIFIIFCDIWIR